MPDLFRHPPICTRLGLLVSSPGGPRNKSGVTVTMLAFSLMFGKGTVALRRAAAFDPA
jgi:hypothetical protein